MADEKSPGRRPAAGRQDHERREHDAAEQASQEHGQREQGQPEYERPGNGPGHQGRELTERERRERGTLSDHDRHLLEAGLEGPASVGHPGWEKGVPEKDERSEEDRVREVERITAESPQGYSPTAGLGTS
jgi:hypothetical protein